MLTLQVECCLYFTVWRFEAQWVHEFQRVALGHENLTREEFEYIYTMRIYVKVLPRYFPVNVTIWLICKNSTCIPRKKTRVVSTLSLLKHHSQNWRTNVTTSFIYTHQTGNTYVATYAHVIQNENDLMTLYVRITKLHCYCKHCTLCRFGVGLRDARTHSGNIIL